MNHNLHIMKATFTIERILFSYITSQKMNVFYDISTFETFKDCERLFMMSAIPIIASIIDGEKIIHRNFTNSYCCIIANNTLSQRPYVFRLIFCHYNQLKRNYHFSLFILYQEMAPLVATARGHCSCLHVSEALGHSERL